MNVTPENIIVNSCEYTPIYLIPSTSVTQAGSYLITQSTQEVTKPVADNLKTFYENSGNLESSFLSSPKPRILKKQSASVVGNKLKLASFLLPKTESVSSVTAVNIQSVGVNKQVIAPVNNVIVKPVMTAVPISSTINNSNNSLNNNVTNSNNGANNSNVDHLVPRVEIDRKIVRVGTIPPINRTPYNRVFPKNRPNIIKDRTEVKSEIRTDPNPSKHTSVQLIKLGETYHSLNQLSDEQMKIVNKALKMFSDPEKIPKEPAYDPVTNTKFIYKVVSPKDLTVVGRNKVNVNLLKKKNKLIMKDPDMPNKIAPKDLEFKSEINVKDHELKSKINIKDNVVRKKATEKNQDIKMKVIKDHETKKSKVIVPEEPEPDPIPVEPKVTRSGRTVKLPKQMRPGPRESPHKPRKKVGSVVNCFQCSAEFCSFYRLQRHYEMYPTHIPARIHSNLFHCLLAIIKGSGDDEQANIFIQQLEQLIEKLKTLLPCLLKKIDGKDGKLCTINDDIARIFGLNQGKYSLNMDALNCVKDKDGHCIHNPAPKNIPFSSDVSKPSQMWLTKHNEELANNEAQTEDCARINSVDKWPTVSKRIWKLKQQKHKLNAKKMRLISETDQPIELVIEDAVPINKPIENCAIKVEISDMQPVQQTMQDIVNESEQIPQQQAAELIVPVENQSKLKTHAQFRSTHFDIRSSPIKLPSALARKFQFNPEKLTKLEVQILQPLSEDNIMNNDDQVTQQPENQAVQQPDNNFHEIFKDNVELPKENEIIHDLHFDHAKNWELPPPSETSQDSFMKSSALFEPSLTTPLKNGSLIDPSLIHVDDKALFEQSPKTNSLIEPNLLQVNHKPDNLIEHSFLQILNVQQPNDFCEPSSIHVKPKCNSLIGSLMLMKDKSFELAVSHVKERSNGLFDSSLLSSSNKTNSLDSLVNGKKDSIFFNSTLEQNKDRNNLFDSSLMDMKDKDSLIDPTLLLKDDSSLFNTSLTPRKDDLLEPPLSYDKVNSLIDRSLMDSKNDVRSAINIDVNHGDSMNANDSRLLSNQGQSVLNFLDSLGNESLGLAYPETEIRNNSVDFQLDLFSFNSS